MKRLFDIIMVLSAFVTLALPILIVALVITVSSPGPVVYWSERVGRNNSTFKMPKFRTMRIETPVVATHLLHNPDKWVTPFGAFLRKSSFDEIPQIWSIFLGDMSFVGPRPALFNQEDLIALRTKKRVHKLLPGLTGWAQVNGRDEISIDQKVKFDTEYLELKSLRFDFYILWLTFLKVFKGDGVLH
jgi:O-antigen biosynthesis protein WbqP